MLSTIETDQLTAGFTLAYHSVSSAVEVDNPPIQGPVSVTTYFYAPAENFTNDEVRLPEEEAHHVARVLRLGVGAHIEVVDGRGGWHKVVLSRSEGKDVTGRVIERKLGVGELMFDLRIGLSIIKNRSRLDAAVEKLVELGVREITLLDCQNSESARVDLERCNRIAKAAMKQSKRSILPRISGPIPFASFVADANAEGGLICHNDEASISVLEATGDVAHREQCLLLVGPEGGFSDDEVARALGAHFVPVSLGGRRLRSETAAIVGCSSIMLAVDRHGLLDRGQD